MILREVVERFEKKAPVCVMVRAAMENVLSAERLDAIFEKTADQQKNKKLMFSTVVDIMGLVACKIHPSPHAAYQAKQEEVAVTVKALYDKLQRMEKNLPATRSGDGLPDGRGHPEDRRRWGETAGSLPCEDPRWQPLASHATSHQGTE